MSIRVMSWVWENSRAEGIDRLVLLAIADAAGDDGGNAWPSVATLAAKARVAERTVQRAVRRLAELGELAVQANAGRHGVNVYKVLMKGCHRVTPVAQSPPSGSHPVTRSGVTLSPGRGVTQTPEPSLTKRTPQPPASGGRSQRPHCDRHHRWRRDCPDCVRALDPPKPKPEWCGTCDQRTRLRDRIDEPSGDFVSERCPDCHPLRADNPPIH